MTKPALFAFAASGLLLLSPSSIQAQGGDQFLDGIGETALVARYPFAGNANDASRNSQHAVLNGVDGKYVEDAQFGRVLSLPGGEGAFVQIPGRILDGLETISIAGWLKLREVGPARFFDFGLNTQSNFFCTPNPKGGLGFQAGITRAGLGDAKVVSAAGIPTNRWVHVAVVLDAARKTLTTYLDGKAVGQREGVQLTLEQVVSSENGNDNHALLGAAQDAFVPHLNALVHDVRIYSIALTERQVEVIHRNSLESESSTIVADPSGQTNQVAKPRGIAQPMASLLVGVKDVEVVTGKGNLPRLPYRVPGLYQGDLKGPDIRVIWPAPTDNREALTNETYTIVGNVPGTGFDAKATVTVESTLARPVPKRQLEAFPLGAVTLLPDQYGHNSQFMENRDKFLRVLAKTNPDSFLYMFRNAYGQLQPEGATPLGGWDSQTTKLRGHATGHYLSAIAQAYASTTYDQELHANFQGKMDYLINVLYQLSRLSGAPTNPGAPHVSDPTAVPPAPGRPGYSSDLSEAGIRTDYWNWGKGFISAYPPDQFILLEQGATYGGSDKQIWAPYYTLHKILAGLLDCYEVGGNEKALVVAQDMARWVQQRLQVLPVETRISMWNRYIAGEYGGMNEVLARLGRLTADPNFLATAKLFDNINFFFGSADHSGGLVKNIDTLRGKHANQHIPQIIGALETYRDTDNPEYWWVAENFWEICRHSYMYSIGGVAGARKPNNAECFTADPDSLFAEGFSNGGQNETCATYNLLKLSRQLFLFDPDARYMDYYERALYNHILASVAEHNPGNTYHVPLNPGARKQFGNAQMDGFTCCNGTALESNTKLQDSIYFQSADGSALYVNLFVPSRLDWQARKVRITQETDFPHGDSTKLRVSGNGEFVISLRIPVWAHQGAAIRINGAEQNLKLVSGSYATLKRNWRDGDVVELLVPFDFHLMPVMDQPNIASLFYGPILLAAQESEPRATWRSITLNGKDPGSNIVGDPHQLRFKCGEANFKPFYETYGRSSVYLDVTLE